MLIKNGDSPSFHYIAGISTGGGGVGGRFRFYNTGITDENDESIDGRVMSMWQFIDYVKASGGIPIQIIGASIKKGDW